MQADIILYAILAIGILFWLKNTIGMRDENDDLPKRKNPYSDSYKPDTPANDKGADKAIKTTAKNSTDITKDDAPVQMRKAGPENHPDVDNKTAETALVKISISDSSFDVDTFLSGAKKAFEMIVTAFSKGDRDTLKGLLSDAVFKSFDSVIKDREKKEQRAETKIHEIRRAEIVAARLEGKQAYITVRFAAIESHVTRDKNGEVVYGDPNDKNRLVDVWVFYRDLKSKDPKWLLVETHDDDEEDYHKTPLPEVK